MNDSGSAFLLEALRTFRGYKARAEAAFAQLGPEDWFRLIDPEAISIAVIVKHLAGNMRSRWTDFLTSDGEKPNRDRDSEFVLDCVTSPEQVMEWWNKGWQLVFAAIEPLSVADLDKKITIRGQQYSALEAISRQMAHYAEHIGQIILLAKHFRGSEWQSLTIAKGQSARLGVSAELANRARRG